MARGPRPFTESDVKAALNGALKAGCEVARLEIDLARKIVLIMGKPQDTKEEGANEWDGI
jgi:hypothetical protein